MKDIPFWTKLAGSCHWLSVGPPDLACCSLLTLLKVNCNHHHRHYHKNMTSKKLFQIRNFSRRMDSSPNIVAMEREIQPKKSNILIATETEALVENLVLEEWAYLMFMKVSLLSQETTLWALNVFDVGTWDQGRSGGFLPDRDFKGGKLILSDPCGCLKGPRVGLNDPLWCILSMWNVLWSFWASQGSIWGTRQFHPVEPSI